MKNPFRSVGALLSIALSLVVVGALLIVYFMVVPSLQDRLVDTKIKQLEAAAPGLRSEYQKTPTPGEFADTADAKIDAQVVTFDYFTDTCCNSTDNSLEGQSRDGSRTTPSSCVPRGATRSSTGLSSATATLRGVRRDSERRDPRAIRSSHPWRRSTRRFMWSSAAC